MIGQTLLEIKRGDSKDYTLIFKDEDGNYIDITGWTVFFTAKIEIDDTDEQAVIKKTITVHTNPTAGQTKIQLTSSDTNLTQTSYVYDIQIKKSTGEIKTIVEGLINITKDVTQRTS
jgi:hypothetical protein